MVGWIDYLVVSFMHNLYSTSINIHYFCVHLKRIVAILNLAILAWCLSPWQLLCIDHDHFNTEKKVQAIAHYKDNTAFHGCDLDFFSAFHNLSFFQLQISNYSVCFYSPKIVEKSFLESAIINGRAPPQL
jgi:hypothetical protein